MHDHHPQIPGVAIERELGRGAYSIVYGGRLGTTPCAVKVPRTGGRWTRWVYREAVALARVRDPGLPAVLEVGEVDGLPYLVMELVEGRTLAEALSEGERLDEAQLDALATQLARTLGRVHDAGLIHRDVKPRNVMLGPNAEVRLVDFGFATPIERVDGSTSTAGTPAYAAPEQLDEPARVDGRADLFGLGRVLFECATGSLPQSRDADVFGALLAHGISRGLATLIAGLLPIDPDHRYPDARALGADLERLRTGREPRGPAGYEAAQRHRAFAGREAELARLHAAASSVGRGAGSVVVVRGVRGSGKSRIVGAAATRWRESNGGASVSVGCRQGDAPLASLRRLLEGFCGERRPDAAAIDHLRAAAGNDLASTATVIAPSLASALGTTGQAEHVAPGTFAEGAAELLIRLARRAGPLLVTVDDAQWADPVSQEVLLCLSHRAPEAPLVLVLAARPGDGAASGASARLLESASTAAHTIELGPLAPRERDALVAAHLGDGAPDENILRRVAVLSDHTPLGVLELLGALLDSGSLRPHRGRWHLDVSRAESVALPEGTGGLVLRRIGEVPPATRAILEVAAVLGTYFDVSLLGRVFDLSVQDVGFGLADARRAGLVERSGEQHRFVHDSVREVLLAALPEGTRRATHQRIAELLDADGETTLEALCARATHYAAGLPSTTPVRALAAARAAAAASIARFDNATGLGFLVAARAAAELAGTSLDVADLRNEGEAHLRLGQLEESRRGFEAALARSTDGLERAALLGRIGWVHQADAQPERAWEALERAFEALGQRMPKEDLASVLVTGRHVLTRAARAVSSSRATPPKHGTPATAILCDLHYQNARLAVEAGRPLRLIESALQALELSERIGAARAEAGARAMVGVILTLLGRKAAGAESLERAVAQAKAARDPATEAFCVQLRTVLACWAGELDEALSLVREFVEVHGHWLELTELCLNVSNAHMIQTLRGCPREAAQAFGAAVDRLSRNPRPPAPLAAYVRHREISTRVQLCEPPPPDPAPCDARGLLHIGNWGSRAFVLLERDDLGPRFDALVRAFDAEKHNPRTAHLVLVEYYIAIGHARVDLCLRASGEERRRRIPALRRAVADLRLIAKIDLFKAHLVLLTGYLAWLEGKPRDADRALAAAETLARDQSCPWVLHGVARARAHMLRARGNDAAAIDQARVAELLAREHGAESRARRVAREFGLSFTPTRTTVSAMRSTSSHRSNRARRQLAALLQIVRAGGADVRADRQAEGVLDELLRDVDAERAVLWFQPDPAVHTRLVLDRTRGGDSTFDVDGWRYALLELVREQGEPWPAPGGARGRFVEAGADPTRVIALPLLLYGRSVGAVTLERKPDAPSFGPEDRELLIVLAQQVPLALEIGRLLAERQQLQASLQQAQKMEAVGQLAGGVAHDFNNMLMAIQGSLDALAERIDDDDAATELAVAANATERAGHLTRQLLTFSRHQPVPPGACDPNELLRTIEPMLRRLVGARVTLSLELDPRARRVRADGSAFEQAMVNLAVNARDAMPAGGELRIATRNVVLDESHVRRGASPGDHVTVVVDDQGQGMTPELLTRVFEPFFTTKAVGSGTGLGLTMVYAFVKNSGGHIEVNSAPGAGTTFLLHLPTAEAKVDSIAPPAPRERAARRGVETVLVIDDERMVSRSIQKMLERSGYRVLVAHTAEQALDVVGTRGDEISLVIIDMLMPGMSGPELGRRFTEMQLPAKLLYISGYAPESLPAATADMDPASFLQKPFLPADLLGRIGQILDT